MQPGSMLPPSREENISSSKVFSIDDPTDAVAGATGFGLVGAVIGGVGGGIGTAAVIVSLPGLLVGVGTGAALYGSGCALKWGYRKIRNLVK